MYVKNSKTLFKNVFFLYIKPLYKKFQWLKFVFLQIGEALSSKLASLSLSSVMKSTPPALQTPSPPAKTSDPLVLKSQPGFRIEVMRVEDSERVLEFLMKNFFVDEPMNASLRLLEKPGDRCIPLEDFALADIHQGLSVMAVDDDGKILGVLLGAAVYRHESEQVKKPKND